MITERIFYLVAVALAACFVGLIPDPARAREKHALIIANEIYEHGGSLTNPVKDSKALAATLTDAGFKVQVKKNLDYGEMRTVISEFGLAHSASDDVTMLYYSGHGAEFNGHNYLIPVDAKLQDARKARQEALTLDDVQNFMYREISEEERATGRNSKGLNIIVLDACRNNPYPARAKSASRGLGETEGASGTLIWYAAQPGARADDGETTSLSPFAASFVDALKNSSGETVEETFKEVARLTLQATQGRQEPWLAGNILGRFSFKPGNSTNDQRILAKYDPSRLDENVQLYAPDNPSEHVIKQFAGWKFGTVAKMGNQPFKDRSAHPWDFDAARLFKAFDNRGPMLNDFSENPSVWRNVDEKLVLGFRDIGEEIIFKPYIDDMSAVFTDKPLDWKANYAITFHKSDGSLKSIAAPFHKSALQCHEFYCGGNTNYEFSPEWVRFSHTEILIGLENVSVIKLEILNYQEMGIRPESAVYEIPAEGLKDALESLIDNSRKTPEDNTIIIRYPDELFVDILNSSGVTKLFEGRCGSYFTRYEIFVFLNGLYGCYYPERTVQYLFTEEFGTDYAADFETLFTQVNRAIGDSKKCPDRLCIDATEVAHLRFFAVAYSHNFAGKTSAPAAVKKAVVSAKRLIDSFELLFNTATTEEDRYRLTNADSYYREKFVHFRNLSNFRRGNFLGVIDQYIDQFPQGNGPMSDRELRSIIGGLNFSEGEYDQKIADRQHAYLKLSRQNALAELESNAWSQCAEEAGFSVSRAKQCYREFGEYFPSSTRLEEAKTIVMDIEAKAVCGAASKIWRLVSLGSNVAVLEAFIKEYSHCDEARLAESKLETLQ